MVGSCQLKNLKQTINKVSDLGQLAGGVWETT